VLHPSPNLYLVRASVRLLPGAGSIRLTIVCTLPLACTLALQTHTNSGEKSACKLKAWFVPCAPLHTDHVWQDVTDVPSLHGCPLLCSASGS
jgi:hypothetical protein